MIAMKTITTLCGAAALAFVLSGSASAASSITRTSSFAYDAASGLLNQEVVEPDTPTLRLETDTAYDAFGNKLSVTVVGADIATRASSSTFDAKGQFANSNTNALAQSETFQYDSRFGKPASHTGPNGLTTTWAYDTFGRKIQEVRSDGTQTKWTYQFCSGVNGGTATCLSGASYLAQETPYASGGTTVNGPVLTVYFDALERELGRDTQGFDGSAVRAVRSYDALGRLTQTSRPFFVSGSTPQYTTFTYDALGRVVTETKPDGGVTQTAYHGLTVTETNTLNQTRTVTKNSQSKVVSVTDALGKTMTYAYDAVGNLIKTTDAVGNVVTASYDLRGRKIASSDPDLGSWSYTYNTLGELLTQTDAKAQTVRLTYDKLDRLVQRVEPDMTSVWTYDTAAHGIGKLASSSITAGPGKGFARSLSYDSLGRAVQIATTIDGTAYAFGATYDANSRLSKINYPSGYSVTYAYTSLGYTNQMLDGTTAIALWSADFMDAEGHLTEQHTADSNHTRRIFDPKTGRLTSINTGTGRDPTIVQNLSFSYDLVGNLASRANANSNMSETFVYDALNRLTSSTSQVNVAPFTIGKAFTYDPIGNMLSKSDVGTYTYPAAGSPRPHGVTSISGGSISTTFTYDADGNQTSGLGRSLVYTSYNKPSSITQGARTISFLDDTEHQRFKQVTPEGTALYISGFGVLAELNNPGATSAKWTDYVAVGNVKVGERINASGTVTLIYFKTDHLGSISVLTGGVSQTLSYDAWGKRRNPNGTDDTTNSITSQATHGFIGEEELSVAGLIHLNGRVYDPILARFTSADPTVTDPLNPQGWNRYSYVGNDPLTFTDPNGYGFFDDFFGAIGNFFSDVFNVVSNAVNSVVNFIASNPIVKAIVQIGVTLAISAILGPGGALASLGLNAGGIAAVSAFGGAAIATGLSGGNLGQVLKSGLIAGASAFAFVGLGIVTPGSAAPLGAGFNPGNYAANVAGSAAVGCLSAVASGGSCGSGAASAAVGSALSPITNSVFPQAQSDLGERIGGTLVQATAGGLASVAGGGKFANGAVTGAFQYLATLSLEDARQRDTRMDAQDRMLEPIGMPGRHEYTAGPNLVCPAAYSCSSEEMADQLSRFAYPGQDPLHPVQDADINVVYAGPLPGGKIITDVSADGLTIRNTTLPLHVFCCGQIVRNVYQSDNGSWFAMTVGSGINLVPGAAITNQITGPILFNGMDQQMLNSVQSHHSTN
jgi:RHS repeat-associated protein